MTESQNPADSQHHSRHEPNRINARAIITATGGVIALVGFAMASMNYLFDAFRDFDARGRGEPSSVFDAPQEPPEPRLKTDLPSQMRRLRRDNEQHLSSYGWVDRPTGIARIPIERAMQLIADQQASTRNETGPEQKPDRTPKPQEEQKELEPPAQSTRSSAEER